MDLNVLLIRNIKSEVVGFRSHPHVDLQEVWADPSMAQAGICIKSGGPMAGFLRHQAEGAIKQPVPVVSEEVGKHCQKQVPMGQSCKSRE